MIDHLSLLHFSGVAAAAVSEQSCQVAGNGINPHGCEVDCRDQPVTLKKQMFGPDVAVEEVFKIAAEIGFEVRRIDGRRSGHSAGIQCRERKFHQRG